ncbi:transposase [Adhaeribacter soli]|uniref:Transposase n=1 Tax=Adhaeribacter soli TaxID=2607655 RepID=A0A5N1J3A1_9BACT|nr:transposase [Adhaeribacter soli]
MVLGEVYFWTNTIKDWRNLLKPDKYKQLIIQALLELKQKNLFAVYGLVIMPNHLHLLWEPLQKNGREMPHASFNKITSHEIIKDLKLQHQEVLPYFKVQEKERQYRIWQRDALAVLMDSKAKFEQKLLYIHLNPLQEKWNLAASPEDYYWSSARFYETGEDTFNLFTHYGERFE